jgi:hypothetical protein
VRTSIEAGRVPEGSEQAAIKVPEDTTQRAKFSEHQQLTLAATIVSCKHRRMCLLSLISLQLQDHKAVARCEAKAAVQSLLPNCTDAP